MKRIAMAFLLLLLSAAPCFAQGAEVAVVEPPALGKQPPVPLYLDEELAEVHNGFKSFANMRADMLNKNHRFSRSRMVISQEPDGSWKAMYHAIDATSLVCKVRRTSTKSAPYVGTVRYNERVHVSRGNTKDESVYGDFVVEKVIPTFNIYRYEKGMWK